MIKHCQSNQGDGLEGRNPGRTRFFLVSSVTAIQLMLTVATVQVQADLNQTASQWIEKAGNLIPSTIDALKSSRRAGAPETSQDTENARENDPFYEDVPVRDPFKPIALLAVLEEEKKQKALQERRLAQQQAESETTSMMTEDEEIIPPPHASVQGLIWNTDKPQALVDYRIVQPGDSIEGWIVEKIDASGVHVRYEERTHVLKPVMNASSERSEP